MTDNLTRPTSVPVESFLRQVEPERRRHEGERLTALFSEVTGTSPVMWGPSIIGFGSYHYRYASGREGDAPRVGFSPRKAKISLYGLTDSPECESTLAQLGPHSRGASCVYVTRLDAISDRALRLLIGAGWAFPRS